MASGPRLTYSFPFRGQARPRQPGAVGLSHGQEAGGPAAARKAGAQRGRGLGRGGPATHPPPMGCGGEQRRFCSLPSQCHHMAHHISVTAWNEHQTGHHEPGLCGLGTVRGVPPAPHHCAAFQGWAYGGLPLHLLCMELCTAMASRSTDTTPVPTLVPGDVTCQRSHSALPTMPGGHGLAHLASPTQAETQQTPFTDTCIHRCVPTLSAAQTQALCGGGFLDGPLPLSCLLGAGPGGGEAHC